MSVPNVLDAPVWQALLTRKRDGSALGHELNVVTALENAPELRGIVRYNEFADEIELRKPPPWRDIGADATWTETDRVELQLWLQEHDINVARGNVVQDAVVTVARRYAYDPLVEYLNGLRWDGKPRLATWLQDYLGAKGDDKYLSCVGPRILIGAVARALEPGCKVDTVPVLEGAQGLGKSRAVEILGAPWSSDGVPDLSTKDAAIQIQGVWIVELEELASMSRADVEHVKAFLSRTVDRYRPPYGRNAINRPRRCVFIASTNLQDYLKDETGNRRFWPIRCRQILHQRLEEDKDQLWAEAVHCYEQGMQWHLSDDEEVLAQREQEARRLVPELEADLLNWLDEQRSAGRRVVYMREMLKEVAGIHDFARDRYHAGAIGAQFSRTLIRCGWEKKPPTGRGENRKQPYVWAGS